MRRRPGFTLLELVVVLAVLGILLAAAVPSWSRYAQRGHRVEAVRTLLAIAACQERLRATTGHYDTSRCMDGLEQARYRFRIEPDSQTDSPVYRIHAIPRERGEGDRCGGLSLDQAGTKTIGGPPELTRACWSGR